MLQSANERALKGRASRPPARRVMAVDLFCGAGGLTRGLIDAGVDVAAGYDIDGASKYAYEHNNKSSVFINESVADITGEDLSAHYPAGCWRVLVGCAPCQPFSIYVQGRNSGADAKWGLLYHFGRLAGELSPDIISMENVLGLQRHKIYREFLATLDRLGYHVSGHELYCPDYGIPQNRTRLVLFASRHGPIHIVPPTHEPEGYVTVRSALSDLARLKAGGATATDQLHRSSSLSAVNLLRIKHSKPGGTWRDWPKGLIAKCHRKKKGKTYPSVYGRMKWDKPSPTITTQFFGFGNGRFGHPDQDRAISLREGAMLQTFPRDYEFVEPGTQYSFKAIGRMIGNAVPVRLGVVIGKTIVRHLEKL